MKAKFNVKGLELGNLKLGGIEIETEFSPKELYDIYQIQREVINDLPEILCDLAKGYIAFEDINSKVMEYINDDCEECEGCEEQAPLKNMPKEEVIKDLISRLTGVSVENLKIEKIDKRDIDAQG